MPKTDETAGVAPGGLSEPCAPGGEGVNASVSVAAAPVLSAYASARGGLCYVWCDRCRLWHTHGNGDGHRGAHCRQAAEHYPAGYILQVVSTVPAGWCPEHAYTPDFTDERCPEHGCYGCYIADNGRYWCDACDALDRAADERERAKNFPNCPDGEDCDAVCEQCERCKHETRVCRWCLYCDEHGSDKYYGVSECAIERWDKFVRDTRYVYAHSFWDLKTKRWSR